ncbi:MAG TPA: hypothetical protein VMS65_15880, partial [Polyangiaceae bacterium]|nr:hypothetical protein [Polyangiaceae bacterium]
MNSIRLLARLGSRWLPFLLLLVPALAVARPGGGDLFGDGSSPSGGGGGGGGDVDVGIVIELVALCIREPVLGGFVVICFIGYLGVKRVWKGSALPDWSTGVPPTEVPAARAANVA